MGASPPKKKDDHELQIKKYLIFFREKKNGHKDSPNSPETHLTKAIKSKALRPKSFIAVAGDPEPPSSTAGG